MSAIEVLNGGQKYTDKEFERQFLNVKVIAKVSDRENDNFLDNLNVNISISL